MDALHTHGKITVRFLPSSYTPYGTNPLVIAMDPNGVALSMMSALRHSAERFGWVVIACNTTQNGRRANQGLACHGVAS
jgi:hypothetical protein